MMESAIHTTHEILVLCRPVVVDWPWCSGG